MASRISTWCRAATQGVVARRFLLAVVGWITFVDSASAVMTVGELRCEYAINPIGIDTLHPRLSWTLLDDRRDQRQSAYQIRVADAPENLKEQDNLLWDSGKIGSDQNTHIVYAGKKLCSGSRCYWQVRVWDKQDRPSSWSEPCFWQIALLDASDWKAQWIGSPHDAGYPAWRDTTLAADITLQKNAVGIVFRAQDANNLYMWQFNNGLGSDLLLRPHVLKDGKWSMLPPVSLRQTVPAADDFKTHRIEIETRGPRIRTRIDGKLVDERNDPTFTHGTIGFRADGNEQFTVANLAVVDNQGTKLLQDDFSGKSPAFLNSKAENGRLVVTGATLLHRPALQKDCPRLRKAFTLGKPVRRATASVCGLGFYELYVNGTKADDRVLAPANTSYSQRILFDTIDVTTKVRRGANVLGLWLAPGYSDDYSQYGWKWEDAKQAILQLDILFEDGEKTAIVSDGSWQAGASPLSYASLYHGEVYDASRETPDWAKAGFAADGWQPVRVLAESPTLLKPNVMPPIRVNQRIRPVQMTEPKPGVFIFDMGQAFAGWVRLRAKGPQGTRIVVRHSELLGKDGLLDPWTNRNAKATDTFILRGNGTETYEPRFTYHGFRYVEVTGYPGRPTLDDVTGCVVHAAVQLAGTFVSSDKLLNRIESNCVWSMRSNFMSIPTDCCMRDERTPCQMDSLAYEDAALCHFWMNRYYTKWLDDISGGQGNPDWNGDTVFLPWRLYREYRDLRILETHYPKMRAYVEFLHAKTPNHIYTEGFGDWCPPNNGTWEGFHGNVTEVNTTLYAALVRIVSDTASLLGKPEDAKRFAQLAEDITRSYNEKRFRVEQGAYGDGSQTAAIMPLALGIVPADRRVAVFGNLVATIREKDKGHLDTGIFGTRYLVDVLSDFGEADLALRMLKNPEYPGFGDQIAQGATTLWEQWAFKGGMHSHNHAMFAGVSSSFFTRLAGITPLEPGYAKIGVRPAILDSLSFVEARQDTVRGRVAVRWQRNGEELVVTVTVPVNASAKIAVPANAPNAVTESGKPADRAEGVSFLRMEQGRAVYVVGSGTYCFTTTAKTAKNASGN